MKSDSYIKAFKVKDIKTQLVDGKGKLGLVLECYGSNGMLSEVNIPDIDLTLPILEFIRNNDYLYNTYKGTRVNVRGRYKGYISFKINEDKDGTMATFKKIERTVSKEDLEKELGYKINFI